MILNQIWNYVILVQDQMKLHYHFYNHGTFLSFFLSFFLRNMVKLQQVEDSLPGRAGSMAALSA